MLFRGHGSSMYLDVLLMVGGALFMGFGDFLIGIILIAAGFAIHTAMGD